MKKHVMIATIAVAFGLAPLAAVAQDHTIPDSTTSSGAMNGSSNTTGMTEGRSDSLRNDSASGLAHEDTGQKAASPSAAPKTPGYNAMTKTQDNNATAK